MLERTRAASGKNITADVAPELSWDGCWSAVRPWALGEITKVCEIVSVPLEDWDAAVVKSHVSKRGRSHTARPDE